MSRSATVALLLLATTIPASQARDYVAPSATDLGLGRNDPTYHEIQRLRREWDLENMRQAVEAQKARRNRNRSRDCQPTTTRRTK